LEYKQIRLGPGLPFKPHFQYCIKFSTFLQERTPVFAVRQNAPDLAEKGIARGKTMSQPEVSTTRRTRSIHWSTKNKFCFILG
jgi:hypothetical protein